MKATFLKTLYTLVTLFFAFSSAKAQQCNKTATITICDITTIDFDTDGSPDGIINLYDEYFTITGENLERGTWSTSADISITLSPETGDISVWDLRTSTSSETPSYVFQLFNTSCGDTPAAIVTLELGPFSGVVLPPFGVNNVNLEICEGSIDLFSALISSPDVPPPHLNGNWVLVNGANNATVAFTGTKPGEISIEIDYQPGIPLVDQAILDFSYTVSGGAITCNAQQITNVRISAVRQVEAGEGSSSLICESSILNGDFDTEINLRDDQFLEMEDIEGQWTDTSENTTGEVADGNDSNISLRAAYDNIVAREGIRFGCETIEFTYTVEKRSGVCISDETTVDFTLFEDLRPFQQVGEIPKFCANGTEILNLFDFIEFTNEGGIDFIYDNDQYVNWQQKDGPSSLNILNVNYKCSSLTPNPTDLHLGIIESYDVVPGIYTFEYGVSPDINCKRSFPCNPFTPSGEPANDCDCNKPCGIEKTEIQIEILPYDYAGQDTPGIEVCENTESVSLVSLLDSSSEDRAIITTGVWTNELDEVIPDTFMITTETLDQEYNFTYTTTHPTSGCVDVANLNFRVIRENTSPAGESVVVKLCATEDEDKDIVLFDQLGGSPVDTGTWTGPEGYMNPDHRAEFVFNDLSFPRLMEGVYTYTVVPDMTTDCFSEDATATVTIEFIEPLIAPDIISGIFCKVQGSVDLLTLLPNTIDPNGTFTEVNTTGALTGSVVSFENLVIERYNFEYTLPDGGNPCEPPTITIEITLLDEDLAGSAGEDNSISVCSNELSLNLYDQLLGNPVTVGTWTGPFGYSSDNHLGVFSATNPEIQRLAEGTYVYTVGAGQCSTSVDTASVTINFVNPIEIGENINITRCKSDGSLNLFSLLDRDTPLNGVFVDTNNTEALTEDGTLDFTKLDAGIQTFNYEITNEDPCKKSVLTIEIRLVDLPIPAVPQATFCVLDAKRLNDIEVLDVPNFVWYRDITDTNPIIDNPKLFDKETLYLASIDAENCESTRVEVPIRILNVGEKVQLRDSDGNITDTIECPLDFQDGVSPNQDGQFDTFALVKENEFNIPEAFPDFSLKIYNRFGTIVFEGNRNTEEFKGENNVDLSLGSKLSTGVYFYQFEPNFNNNLPISGSFYLSK